MAKRTVKTRQMIIESDEDLASLLSGLSPDGDWVVKIYARIQGNQVWKANWPPAECTEANIAKTWGGGTYLCRPLNTSTGKWGSAKQIHIASDADGVKAQTETSVVEYVDGGNGNQGIELFKMQMQMQKESADRSMQMFQQFNTTILGLITSLITAKSNGGGGSENLAMLKELLGVAREIGNGGSEPPDPMQSMLSILPQFLLAGRNGNAAAAMPAAPGGAIAAPAIPQPPPQPPSKEQTEMLDRMKLLQRLKNAAQQHGQSPNTTTAPVFWADYLDVNATAGDSSCKAVVDAITQYPFETIFAQLVSVDAELQSEPYASWFRMLYAEVRGEGARVEPA